ncbi:MAG: hypothetical protein ACRDTQ_18110, partial [Micromonosporaceae bacterium]
MNPPASALRRALGVLPDGAPPVAAGLGVLGLAAYGYLAIAGRALDAHGHADLAVLWMLVFSIG